MRFRQTPPLAALLAMLLLLVLLCTASGPAAGQEARPGPVLELRGSYSAVRTWSAPAPDPLPATAGADRGVPPIGGFELPRPWLERWAPPAAWQSVTPDLRVGMMAHRSLSSYRLGSRRVPALLLVVRWSPPM